MEVYCRNVGAASSFFVVVAQPQVDAAACAGIELCDHVLSLLNAALASPEAQQHLPLRKRFVGRLLDKGARPILAWLNPLLRTCMAPVVSERAGGFCMP